MYEDILNDDTIPEDEKADLIMDEIETVLYGVHDVTGIPRILCNGGKREKRILDFVKEHPGAVLASGYESETKWLLAWRPEKLVDDIDFKPQYTTPIILVAKDVKELMFVLNH